MSLFWFIAAAIILGYVLTQTKFGNWIQASGGNPGAARARGVNVDAHQDRALHALLGDGRASPAIISSIRTSAANPNSGTGYELEVIAMVVIGGTALTGGRGTIIGTVLGVFILRVMRNGIVLIGVPGPRLQHLHRRDHPRDDGAPLLARTPAPGGDLSHGRRTDPHGAYQQVLRPRPGARGRDPDGRRARDRRPARRQRRRQVDADQGALRRRPDRPAATSTSAAARSTSAAPPTPSPTASRRSTRTRPWSRSSRSPATSSSAASRSRARASSTAWTRRP